MRLYLRRFRLALAVQVGKELVEIAGEVGPQAPGPSELPKPLLERLPFDPLGTRCLLRSVQTLEVVDHRLVVEPPA